MTAAARVQKETVPETNPLSIAAPLSKVKQKRPAAGAYFEYSVFCKFWSDNEQDASAKPITSAPLLNVLAANAFAENIFDTFREQYVHLEASFQESSIKQDEHDCATITGIFSPSNDPLDQKKAKVWVERHEVSKHAAKGAGMFDVKPVVATTVYSVRLFEVVDGNTGETSKAVPNHRAVVHTSRQAANVAAHRLQVDLKRKDPGFAAERSAHVYLNELNLKLKAHQVSTDARLGLWSGKFSVSDTSYRVSVEAMPLRGPRNL